MRQDDGDSGSTAVRRAYDAIQIDTGADELTEAHVGESVVAHARAEGNRRAKFGQVVRENRRGAAQREGAAAGQ